MKFCRAALLSCLLFINTAFANTFTTDLTDIWWNPSESGWGVTLSHQTDFVFLTFFVYGPDNRPKFYTGQASFTGSANGQIIFSGPVFETTGPWLGLGAFNPNAVTARQVGTTTLSANVSAATLTYSIDGVSVTKSIQRQTFRNNSFSGTYLGVFTAARTGCANPANNGTSQAVQALNITMTASTFTMRGVDANSNQICTYNGNYTQTGRMGRSTGTFSCPATNSIPIENGTYDFFELEANKNSVTGRFSLASNICASFRGHHTWTKLIVD